MYRLNKVFSFHTSIEERKAIKVLRNNGINISSFLRRSLRDQAEKLRCQNEKANDSESAE